MRVKREVVKKFATKTSTVTLNRILPKLLLHVVVVSLGFQHVLQVGYVLPLLLQLLLQARYPRHRGLLQLGQVHLQPLYFLEKLGDLQVKKAVSQ